MLHNIDKYVCKTLVEVRNTKHPTQHFYIANQHDEQTGRPQITHLPHQ